MDRPVDTWANGVAYEPFVGRWSRAVAREFVEWLAPAPRATWLDVGCGTGALTQVVFAAAAPRRVLAIDAARGFIACAAANVTDARAGFAVADARALPVADASLDLAVSALALNFVPEPARATAEMARVVRPGGTVAAYVWDYADGMQFLRLFWEVATALDPAAGELDEGRRFPICQPGALMALFRGAGLEVVETCGIEVPTRFRDFDDFWQPFLGGQGPAPGYVERLDGPSRQRLREALRAALQPRADEAGAVALRARAWAVRGRRPVGPIRVPAYPLPVEHEGAPGTGVRPPLAPQ
jgi:SAM-dependent methyltransferase